MARVSEVFIGARFGKLTVISERTREHQSRVNVRCDCGNEKAIYVHALGKMSNSCGCGIGDAQRKHGMSTSREYKSWEGIIQRCTNPRYKHWDDYGGRGITVCEQWLSFANFYADMGPRPTPAHSIDRINNDGNYEPSNCRWATAAEQVNNRRITRRCRNGHLREGDNVKVMSDGTRRCRACYIASQKAYRDRKATQSNAARNGSYL